MTHRSRIRPWAHAVPFILAAVLAACGGGSSDPATSPPANETPGNQEPPPPTPPPAQFTLQLTPEKIAEIKHNLATKTRAAAGRGETEVLVMRFPSALCTDKGRAINNAEADWPSTLTGRPRQAYEFWKEHLQPAKYKLRAIIIDWPGGLPGDVAFFLSWS